MQLTRLVLKLALRARNLLRALQLNVGVRWQHTMDDSHASALLSAVLSEYERKPFDILVAAVGVPATREVHPPNGARFQVAITVARAAANAIRVDGRITDGRGRVLCKTFHRRADGHLEYGAEAPAI